MDYLILYLSLSLCIVSLDPSLESFSLKLWFFRFTLFGFDSLPFWAMHGCSDFSQICESELVLFRDLVVPGLDLAY